MALITNWCTTTQEEKTAYVEKCKLFVSDDEMFKNFRQDTDYGKILEGNEEIVGYIALESLYQFGGWGFLMKYIGEFVRNDDVGNPLRGTWENLSHKIAASTLRYINTAWEIKGLLGEYKPKRILEIGGGYGGLCRILSVMYDFEEYTNKDLPEAEALFNKYISCYPELRGRTNNEIKGDYDLFIADSSLSECDWETQLEYASLAKDCLYIYFTYNSLHIKEMEKNLRKLKKLFKDFWGVKNAPLNIEGEERRYSNTFCLKKYDR